MSTKSPIDERTYICAAGMLQPTASPFMTLATRMTGRLSWAEEDPRTAKEAT